MTTPQKRPDLNSHHASVGEKVRNARASFSDAGGGSGIGETPNSRLKKFSIWFVIFLIVLLFFMEYLDFVNAKNAAKAKALQNAQWAATREARVGDSE